MSADQMTDFDAEIRAAFEALSDTVPVGYFDDFESRLQARLEEDAMTEIADNSQMGASPSPERSHVPAVPMTTDTPGYPNQSDDDSGLHDIRALAAKTKERVSRRKSAERPDEPLISSVSLALRAISLPESGKDFKVFAGDDAPNAAAVAMREQDNGLPTWIYAAMSAIAAAAVVFFLLRGDKRSEPTQPAETARADVVNSSGSLSNAPGLNGVDKAGTVEDENPAASTNQGGVAVPGLESKTDADGTATEPGSIPGDSKTKTARVASKNRTGVSRKASAKKASPDKKPTSAAMEAKPKSVAKKPKKKPDTLEELLNAAGGDGASSKKADKKPDKAPAPAKPTRTKLDSGAVKTAIGKLKKKTQACYDKYKQPGLVSIKFSIDPSGKVTSSTAKGKFKGTDTGACVAAAVKKAKFPAFNGPPMTFTFPVFLTQ